MKKKLIMVLFFIITVINIIAEELVLKNTETKKIKTTKETLGISPMFLISMLADEENRTVMGSAYVGFAEKRKEIVLGLGIEGNGGFELTLQKRKYSKKNATGFFTGLYSSAGIYKLKTYLETNDTNSSEVIISSTEGKNFYSWGVRVGGNVGYRGTVAENLYITPKLGLVIPLLIISGNTGYDKQQMKELYIMNSYIRMIDIGLHIETSF